MNNQKSKSIEKRRILNIEIGLVAALSLLLVAFNWNSNTPTVENLGVMTGTPIEDILIQTTQREKIKKPELPKKKYIPEFEIIDNTDVDDDITIKTEFIEDEAIKISDIPMEEEKEVEEIIPFVGVPEKPAEFKGGLEALYGFIYDRIKYPEVALRNGISGKVYVQFKVGPTGEISDIIELRSPDPSLTEEAIRVLKLMPDWIPAEQGGRKVYTNIQIPITFKLN
jgi:protein TonB